MSRTYVLFFLDHCCPCDGCHPIGPHSCIFSSHSSLFFWLFHLNLRVSYSVLEKTDGYGESMVSVDESSNLNYFIPVSSKLYLKVTTLTETKY